MVFHLLPASVQELVRLVRLFLYRMVKRVRRVMGGTSQVERICSGGPGARDLPHTAAMTREFWLEWRGSRRLQGLFREVGGSAELDVSAALARIVALKKVPDGGCVRANLRHCLDDIRGVNAAVAAVKARQAVKFSSANEAHERQLDELWALLLPGQERAGGRITREWGRIGFQQSDPATDFRAGGALSLEQLLYFARERPQVAQRMLREPAAESARYPWACVGINLTQKAVAILESRALDQSLYGKSTEQVFEVFHSMYADMFEILHSMWIEACPENILAFPPVLEKAMVRIHDEINATGTLVPPGA